MLEKLARYILKGELYKLEQDVKKAYDVGLSHGISQGWEQGVRYGRTGSGIYGKYRREIEGILEEKRI